MKALDYQLGNYVRYKDNIIKIDAIHLRKVGFHSRNDKLAWVRIGCIEPIRITKVFMDKNFEFNKDYYIKYFADTDIHLPYILNLSNNNTWNMILMDDSLTIEDDPIIHIKYVHQLQNILKLCDVTKDIIP